MWIKKSLKNHFVFFVFFFFFFFPDLLDSALETIISFFSQLKVQNQLLF